MATCLQFHSYFACLHPQTPLRRTMTMLSNYLYSLSQTPHMLRKRMLATWKPDQEFNQVRQRSGADMKRKLKWRIYGIFC
uniref:Uncharacterized protein LOC101507892 isoform X2 n=1 Tax=Cicer arietinum TaxID=3827 RepID=A0A3Q7YB31_CICAR|nr:uncharacterized protein LOC101507892 isoform X2 [Cicer arietinum]